MNIGIIIFIISVIITGVSALRDKSHEDRQNQRPNQKSSNEQPQEGGFFEKLEKTFKEISDELNDEPEKKQSKPYETSLPPLNKDWNEKEKKKTSHPKEKQNTSQSKRQTTSTHEHQNIPQPDKTTSRNDNYEKLKQELEQDVTKNLIDVRREIDKEKEKQLVMIERKAQDIINDKYLSERTKRYRLKQLLNSRNVEKNMSHSAFQYDSDEVINGIIWSEILSKPKQL
ncbi:iron transporter [Staphylococcus epidermidis]|uniref:iron transporter n=1 Tax=Staphylococcus epidermidis TaxID=1282 RepID=UPI000B5A7222|nr:iron transporter [Staphylococcus epidermidis]ASJ93320.1 iron transporter [Staphylococcus epidermidis]MDH9183378.1 iron transporter [Staphylococcus epidermidis]